VTPRIWPGALCYITHPSMFGRMVEAIHEAPVGVRFRLPDGYMNEAAPTPGFWVCKILGAPVAARCGWKTRLAQHASIEACWLRPITPPPGTDTTATDDRAPCELEHPAFG
jgi:hypothetical protein